MTTPVEEEARAAAHAWGMNVSIGPESAPIQSFVAGYLAAVASRSSMPVGEIRYRHLGSRSEPYEVFEFPKVTRAVVVGKKFVLFDQRDIYEGGVDVVLQDEGRTMKLLPSPKAPGEPARVNPEFGHVCSREDLEAWS